MSFPFPGVGGGWRVQKGQHGLLVGVPGRATTEKTAGKPGLRVQACMYS